MCAIWSIYPKPKWGEKYFKERPICAAENDSCGPRTPFEQGTQPCSCLCAGPL